jgi:hypothetical protein
MISNASSPADANARPLPPIIILLTWLVVLTPLAWGVYNTVNTSTKLFTSASPPVAQPTGVAK